MIASLGLYILGCLGAILVLLMTCGAIILTCAVLFLTLVVAGSILAVVALLFAMTVGQLLPEKYKAMADNYIRGAGEFFDHLNEVDKHR